jgi:twinkle protein
MQKNEQGLYSMPTLYDVSGSSDFRNQTHDGFCVYRYFDNNEGKGYTKFVNLKTKMSFQGEIGASFDFEYHIPTGRYYARGTEPPLFDMTRPREEEQIEMQVNAMTFNDDFENEVSTIENTDIPF